MVDKEKKETELKKARMIITNKISSTFIVFNSKKIIKIEDDKNNKVKKTILIDEKTKSLESNQNKEEIIVVDDSRNRGINLEISKELNQIEREKKIVKKVDNIINQAEIEIIQIKEDLTSLEEVKSEYDINLLNHKKTKFNEIKEKIINLIQTYQILKENFDFSDYIYLNDELLLMEISNYKFVSETQEEIEALANDCKLELKKLELIISVSKYKNNLENKIIKKEKEINSRDKNFNKYKTQIEEELNFDNINKTVVNFNEKLDLIFKNITNNDMDFKKINKNKNEFIINNLLKLSVLMLGVKKNNKALILSSFFIIILTNKMKSKNKNIIDLYKETLKINDNINNAFDEVIDINEIILLSLKEVLNLKEYFDDNFKDYIYLIPEYKDISVKLEETIKNLKEKTNEINNIKEDLNNKKNNQKIKIKKLKSMI